jgi:hypothetical protein
LPLGPADRFRELVEEKRDAHDPIPAVAAR